RQKKIEDSSRENLINTGIPRSFFKRFLPIHLVTKALDNPDQPLPTFPARRLNLLLKPIVLRSHPWGLLTSSEAIELAGDGTTFKTGARSSGRPLCDCHQQGIDRCDCSRRDTDRFASWGSRSRSPMLH